MKWSSPILHGIDPADPQTHPGFWSGVPDDQMPPAAFGRGSRDWVLDNAAREWRSRGGSDLYFPIGMLDAAQTYPSYTMRGVRALTFHSPTMDQNAQLAPDTVGWLMVNEVYGSGQQGQFTYAFEPIPVPETTWRQPGSGMDPATNYPVYHKLFPHCGGARFNSVADRAKHALGSRNVVLMDDRVFFPNFHGNVLPNNWDRRFGGYSGAPGGAFRTERVRPTGHMPSLWPPDVTVPATVPKAGGTLTNVDQSGSWQAGDMFWIAICGIDRNGNYGPMTQLRPPNQYHQASGSGTTRVAGGYGLVLLNPGAVSPGYGQVGNPRYRALLLSIPVMDSRYEKRAIFRSPKVNGTLVGAIPDISDMRPWMRVDNNTETSVYAYDGDDANLTPNDVIARFDHIHQPAARYLVTADGRLLALHTKRNRGQLYVAPKLTGAAGESTLGVAYVPNEINVAFKTGSNEGGNLNWKFYVEVVNTGTESTSYIRFYDYDGTGSGAGIVSTATTDYTFAKFPTLQEMVDAINAQTYGGSLHVYPRAAIFNGADPTAKCVDVLATTLSTGSGTGAYGDGFTVDAVHRDWQRMFGQCWPGILMGKDTYFDSLRERRNYVYFTGAGSGHPKNAPDAWYFGNVRIFPESLGEIVGGCGLGEGALIVGTNGIGWWHNTKGGNTGEDEDYRIDQIPGAPGGIAPDSITSWFGTGLYLGRNGQLMSFGKGKLASLTGNRLYNPQAPIGSRGEWENEVDQCTAATGKDDYKNQVFSVSVLSGSRIRCSYRQSTGLSEAENHAQAQVEYQLGNEAIDGEPLSLLDPDGNPWGWSTPLTLRATAMIALDAGTRARHFGIVNTFSTGVVNGQVREIDTTGSFSTFDDDVGWPIASVTRNGDTRIYLAGGDQFDHFSRVRVGAIVSGTGYSGHQVNEVPQRTLAYADIVATVGTPNTVVAPRAGGFRHLNVGAVANVGGSLRVITAKSADHSTITLNATVTAGIVFIYAYPTAILHTTASAGSGTATFTRLNISATGYTPPLKPDGNPRLKNRATFFTVLYRDAAPRIALARHADSARNYFFNSFEAGWTEVRVVTPNKLTSGTLPYIRWPHRIPIRAQSMLDAVSYRVWLHDGGPAVFRSITTEGESIDAIAL